MKQDHKAFSSTDMVNGCTGEGIQKREMVNKYFIILPIIAFGITFAKFGVTMHHMINLEINPFKTEIKVFFYICLFLPMSAVAIFPVYLATLYLLRNQLKTIFVGLTFASLGAGLAISIMTGDVGAIVTNGIFFLFTALWFWCMWSSIQMAITTIKTALVQVNRKKTKFFFNFVLLLTLMALALGFEIVGSINYSILFSVDLLNDSQKKLAIFFLLGGFVSFLYEIELTAAIAYIYGAAFFNQFSLMKDGKIEQETSKEISQVTNHARNIAFKTSLGAACIGALIITIVRIIEGMAKSGKNNRNLGAKLIGAICSLIADALAFIATQAYVYSAIYGKGLIKSGKMALESFKTSGFDKFFNYTFSDRILNVMAFFFAFIIGLVSGLITFQFGGSTLFSDDINNDMDKKIFISVMFGVFIFFCVNLPLYTVNCVLGGHSSSQIALYVEDPDLLKRTHPRADKFEKLLTAQ